MTEEQIIIYKKNVAEIDALKIKSKMLQREAEIKHEANYPTCDHRFPNGYIAGRAFAGSYCGFFCEICGHSVSYEKMGY